MSLNIDFKVDIDESDWFILITIKWNDIKNNGHVKVILNPTHTHTYREGGGDKSNKKSDIQTKRYTHTEGEGEHVRDGRKG